MRVGKAGTSFPLGKLKNTRVFGQKLNAVEGKGVRMALCEVSLENKDQNGINRKNEDLDP
jgi:hypothetical protein